MFAREPGGGRIKWQSPQRVYKLLRGKMSGGYPVATARKVPAKRC